MVTCPICKSAANFFISKSDRFGQQYEYFRCKKCRFLFDRDLAIDTKKLQNKVNNIYQKDYAKDIDIGWKTRGDSVSRKINKFLKIYRFLKIKKDISVLDYGGGAGYITSKISKDFNVFYYDKYTKPVYNPDNYKVLEKPQKNDVILAVEVVEHITDINEWSSICQLASDVLIFTTELSDGIKDNELIDWWYLRPDGGHVCIYSLSSLGFLAKEHGFVYFFFPSKSFHIFFRNSFLKHFDFVKLEYPLYKFFRKIKNIINL